VAAVQKKTRRIAKAKPRRRALRMAAGDRREQLLDAAEVAFSTKSYRDVGTADVAAQARVSEPTLYRYFASKRDLYLAVLERNAAQLLETWREIASRNPDATDGLAEIGIWYFDQLQKNPAPFLLRARSLLDVGGDEKLAGHARKNFWETFEFIQGLYERARTEGQIARDTDPRAHAWLFMSVGGLLDQFLLMGLDSLDGAEIGRMMEVVSPRPPETPAKSDLAARRRR
jgi:AcrR family transcriptional regulator